MTHENRHAIGLWIVAALLGGFAIFAWNRWPVSAAPGLEQHPPIELPDSAARHAASPVHGDLRQILRFAQKGNGAHA